MGHGGLPVEARDQARGPRQGIDERARVRNRARASEGDCTLAQKDKGEPYEVKLTLAPKVKFKDGKATEASINWGEASAPLFVYLLIYGGTGVDNQANVLGPQVVRMVNEFATRKCAEVKAELSGGKAD